MSFSFPNLPIYLIAVFVFLFCNCTTHTSAWGEEGHFYTAAVAESFLSNKTWYATQNLLQGQNISTVASWADTTARDKYPWSEPLHFIDMSPDWDWDYQRVENCGENGCVDTAIQNFTHQLLCNDTANFNLSEALLFLIHFVGDIHQPLHVGFASNRGGNTLHGQLEQNDFSLFRYRDTRSKETHVHSHSHALARVAAGHENLHQIWDTVLIRNRMQQDFEGDQNNYLQYLVQKASDSGESGDKQWMYCNSSSPESWPLLPCSTSWAQESAQLACNIAYVDEDGQPIQNSFDLSSKYSERAFPIIDQQLWIGGRRLAHLLNLLFDSSYSSSEQQQQQQTQCDSKTFLSLE